jgi:iron complex outermembrane receptor protein
MATTTCITRTPAAAAALSLLALCAHGQQTTATLTPVTVTGKAEPAAGVAGWGDVPLSKSPFQASVFGSEQMREYNVQRLADIVRLDPAASDAYNAEGYWDFLTVRGYVLDNRANYRRDGLPINAEFRIPLDDKERVELLKGTSGLQAGVSAPGGLVNYVVKRPTDEPLRRATLAWQESGSVLAAADLSQRFGVDRAFGLRMNAAAEHLDPNVHDAQGNRTLFALAGDWRIAPGMLLEAEVETSHRSQPSVPGFSLLGANVPAPVDPRINLNNQPWSLPVVFDATDASLRFTQQINPQWRWTAHLATQHLKTDDRIAFPFGCSAEGFTDRFCSDGTFDLYDFRSENERRRTNSLELAVHGQLQTGAFEHAVSAGVLRSEFRARFQDQVFNLAGIGNIDGTLVTPPSPEAFPADLDRDERNTEFFARDAIRHGATTAWLGLRYTRLSRSGSVELPEQSFTTPWVALSHEYAAGQLAYVSWGEGVETAVTPNLPTYGAAAGQPLPALKSKQWEVGTKGGLESVTWNVAAFDIRRPATTDTGTTFFVDGTDHHRGVEASLGWQAAERWLVQGGVQFLHARREGSVDPTVNGKQPVNVPAATLKLQARHDLAAVPGLSVQADVMTESERQVLADNSVRIPGYGRLDAGVRYVQPLSAGTLVWRAGVDNLLDRRAWRESPFQFGHVYLFPLGARTFRVSLEAAL